MLADLATLTSGTVISEELGVKLEAIDLKMLGTAKKGNLTKEETTLLKVKKKDIEGRCNQIRAQIEEATSDYDKEKLQERLAKLLEESLFLMLVVRPRLKLKKEKIE